ncbi:hypothetical protein [Clostridium sp.]|jgi:hypothetical protein|uniref:hypothetical protein n=1 Tax=Clostridium sp. TaxID=1506 RepID=UPI0025910249|nr:hypothetical protein [Clostridium sp.]MDF2502564.1 hypothetical protein [Clostridium sp.]
MLQFIIMSSLLGFTGNRLFNKKDRSIFNSIKWGSIVCAITIVLHLLILKL